MTKLLLHCFKLFAIVVSTDGQRRYGLFSYGKIHSNNNVRADDAVAPNAQQRTFHRSDLNSNSPSRFGFESLDSAQYNVFRNSLRIPWQPLPSSAFIYKSEKNSDARLVTDEYGSAAMTTFQQVSATYRLVPVTQPSYANFQKQTHFDANYDLQSYNAFRQKSSLDNKRDGSDYTSKIFIDAGSILSNPYQSASVLNCFSRFRNCLLVNVASLKRLNYVSVEQCMQRCLNFLKETGVYCAGILYSSYSQSCDLHKTVGATLPGRRILMYGFDFYENCGSCNDKLSTLPDSDLTSISTTTLITFSQSFSATVTSLSSVVTASTSTLPVESDVTETSTIPTLSVIINDNSIASFGITSSLATAPSVECPLNSSPLFLRLPDFKAASTTVTVIHGSLANNESTCRTLCSKNPNCFSYFYQNLNQNCSLFGDNLENQVSTPTMKSSVYAEKICISAALAELCSTSTIEWLPNRLFIGSSSTVQKVETSLQCIELCLNSLALYRFVCLSATYFPRESKTNCLLNEDSIKTRPNFAQSENETLVSYYGLDDCSAKETSNENSLNLDDESGRELQTLENIFIDKNTKDNVHSVEEATGNFVKETLSQGSPINEDSVEGEAEELPQSLEILKLGEWIRWSDCNLYETGRRKRYRYCTESSLELCPVEFENCDENPEDVDGEQILEPKDNYYTLYEKFTRNFYRDNPLLKRLRRMRIKALACWLKNSLCSTYDE